jgi:glycosyltransferase involved in cell wall biosynthesis
MALIRLDKTIRIAVFVPDLHGGGAERVMVALANRWRRFGLHVDLVLQKAVGTYLKDVAPDVNIVDMNVRRLLFCVGPLTRYLRKARPDALLATPSSANIVALVAWALANVPARVVVREAITATVEDAAGHGIRAGVIARLRGHVYRRAAHVVAPSVGVAKDLVQNVGIPPELITVIPNPVDVERIHRLASEPVQDPALREGVKLIIGAGRLDPQKDFATLIRAFAKLKRSDSVLVLLGEGPERADLARLAVDLGVAQNVLIPGFKDNPFPYLRRAAVFVLSSRYEGMPNALLEASALGTAVVATDCPSGPREILESGKWGRLVPVGDVESMANAIAEALRGEVIMPPIRLIEERYGLDTVARRYLNVLAPDLQIPETDTDVA